MPNTRERQSGEPHSFFEIMPRNKPKHAQGQLLGRGRKGWDVKIDHNNNKNCSARRNHYEPQKGQTHRHQHEQKQDCANPLEHANKRKTIHTTTS
jgi:hypothetical protein